MKIVVLASRFPYPLERGDKLRLYQQIKTLSKNHEIVLFACSDHRINKEWYDELKKYCSEIFTYHFTVVEKIKGLFIALFQGLPFQCGQVYSTAFKNQIEMYCSKNTEAVIYCQLIRMAPYCEKIKNRKLLDYMDAFSLSMKKRADISSFPLSLLYAWESRSVKKYELTLKDKFDKFITITLKDAEILGIEKSQKFEVVPNTIDMDYFHNDGNTTPIYDIGFIGNLGYLPNEEAIIFIKDKIMPAYEINYNKPLKLLIAGARPTSEILSIKNENITLWNDVNDIREAYKAIKILVAPITSGTGQQNKVLEAMAMTIPVITTEDVNDGIKAVNGGEILIADNENDFVAYIDQLLHQEELYHVIKNNGLKLIQKKYLQNRIGELF